MKVGLIGCGRVAHIHMSAYQALKNVNVVAVLDTDLKRAKAFAGPYKISKAFTDYKDLFEMADLNFVDVCTPTATHESIVDGAARAGLNVLMEKPMARTSSECERMIETARKHKVQLCICHNQLYYQHVQSLKSIADSEGFGLTSLRTEVRENFEWLKAHGLAHDWNVSPEHKGILWEVGCHLAYLQLHFLKDIEEVYALGVKAKYQVWDDFTVLLRTPSQRFGLIEVSWIAQEPEMMYEIFSSKGRRVQTFLPHGYIIERAQESQADIKGVMKNWLTDEKRLFKKWVKFAKDQINKPKWGHYELIRNFVENLESGIPSPITGEDGRNAVRLLECIEESLEKGSPIRYTSW